MRLKVFMPSGSKPVYERIINMDASVSLDFNLLLRAMKLLYGEKCIVIFECV